MASARLKANGPAPLTVRVVVAAEMLGIGRTKIYEMIAEELQHKTTDEWLALLQEHDIPCIRPHTLDTLIEDPHLQDAGFFVFEEHPTEGRIRTMREPSTWSETPPPSGQFASRLGQETREILGEAGLPNAAIDEMISDKIVFITD